MLHFVPLTFFMQHLFAFIFFFQQITSYLFCFGGPQQHFRPVFSVELVGCSIRPWFHAGVRGGVCPASCTQRGGGTTRKFALRRLQEKDTILRKQTIRVPNRRRARTAFLTLFSSTDGERGSVFIEENQRDQTSPVGQCFGGGSAALCAELPKLRLGEHRAQHGAGSDLLPRLSLFHFCLSEPVETEKCAKMGNFC